MVRERVRVRMLVSAAILLAVALPWFEADRIWGAASSDGAITPIEVSGRTVCPGSVAAVMTNLTGAPADAVEQLQAKYENVDGFRGVVFDGKGAVVIASPETLGSWKGTDSDVSVAVSCVPTSLYEATRNAVEATEGSQDGFVSVGYDALVDSISVITTQSAAALIHGIDANSSTSADRYIATGSLRIREAQAGDFGQVSRGSDSSPFWGGARIITPVGGCTTGFYMSSTTFGTVMATAGHCYSGNSQNTTNGDRTHVVGSSEGWSANDPDLALIDGQNYYRRTYSWNDQQSNKLISDDFNPGTGVVYCQMGATSLRICSAYSQLDVTASYNGRTVHHLAYTSGPSGPNGSLGSAGDSGGGVYREWGDNTLGARGLVVAAGCNSTTCARWDEKVQVIESFYSAIVVTSG